MEDKTNAIVVTVVVLILLFIIIEFKIRSDKKRKSSAIPYDGTTKPKVKKSFIASTPSFALAIISAVVFTPVGFIVDELVHSFDPGGITAYALFGILSMTACYFIIKQHPKSVWYVPLIINALFILSAFVEPNFWKRPPDGKGIPMWVPIISGWILTIFASIIGVWQGNKKTDEN